MKIKIKYGNIIKEQSTFIVNASNTELILGSGVSKAFREHCGGSFFQQKLYKLKHKIGKINQSDVVLSDSGSSKNFKYALHVAVMNYTDDTKLPFPTYKQVQISLTCILKIVEEQASKEHIKNPKVVVPLLGCGTGGLKKEKVFFMIRNTFMQSNSELEVVIYLYEKKDYFKFKMKELKNIANQYKKYFELIKIHYRRF